MLEGANLKGKERIVDMTRRTLHHVLATAAASCILPPWAAANDSTLLAHIHPDLRPFADPLRKMFGSIPPLSAETLVATRQAMQAWVRPPLPAPAWRQLDIPGPSGAPQVTVYVINSVAGASRPAILHMHGGGFVGGQAKEGLAELQELAATLDCTIMTVDYRLAPETSYLGSLADNYAALEWLHDYAPALGVDPARIAVMGESAGGGHAALLALKARDMGKIPLVAQILIYPMLDDRTGVIVTPPYPAGSLVWTAANNRFGWASFLGQAPGTDAVPHQAVPSRRTDMKGLPPTFIGVGAIDLFVNEDITYARALIDAGVQTELLVVPGAFHGFDRVAATTKVAGEFTAAKVNALRRAFAII